MTRKSKSGGGNQSAPTRAVELVAAAGITYTLHHYEHDPRARSFGEETVEKLGIPAERTFKTLMVHCDAKEFVVAILPVDHQLSLKAIAKASGHKAAVMADPAVAQRCTGYVVGGISPLGQTTKHRTFVDESAFDHDTILVSGGRRGLSLELSPWDLLELAEAEIALVTA